MVKIIFKKVVDIFAQFVFLSLLCTRFEGEKSSISEGSWKKFFKIFSKIFGELKNNNYLCTRLDEETIQV